MAFDRIFSILFYLFIAVVTCVMAYRIQPFQAGEAVWVHGRRTAKSAQNRLLMAGIFAILFLMAALRFDIGNDYRQYTQTAHEAYVGGYVVTEVGFNWLVRFLYGIAGGEYYEIVFAVFAFVTLLFFLKAFARQSVSFSQTFFLFMTLGLYFQSFNTVRYYLALAVALFSMKYVLERDFIKFVFWILIAALFHKSVLLVLPVYWIATLEWRRWQVFFGLAVSVACFLGKGLVLKLALMLYPSYRDTIYLVEGSLLDNIREILPGLMRILAVLVLYGWFVSVRAWEDDAAAFVGRQRASEEQQAWKASGWYRELRFYAQLNLLALVTGTFFYFLPVVSRITYYFSVSQLFMIPMILQHIRKESVRRKVSVLVFAACSLYFMVFLLQAHADGVGLLPYRSWLFETQRYIYK